MNTILTIWAFLFEATIWLSVIGAIGAALYSAFTD